MRQFCLAFAMVASIGLAQDGPYKVQKIAKVGGDGGFDYVTADAAGRRLYVGRSANPGRVTVFNLDTLEKVGEIPNTLRVHGATVSPKSHHGFASSNPVVMFDTKTPPANAPPPSAEKKGGRGPARQMLPDSFSIIVVAK